MGKGRILGLDQYFKGESSEEEKNEISKEKISRKEFEKIMIDLKHSIPGLGGRIYKEEELVVDFLLVRRVLERHFEIVEENGKEEK